MKLLKLRKFNKIVLPVALLLLVLAGLIIMNGYFFPVKTEAAWFSDNWGYRKEVPVTANTGVDTNTYISFSLDTATLITNGQLQSSCQDIRVTDQGGNLLKYHIGRTNACNASNTTIDALVPTLAAGASTFYVYYGNPSVVSADAGAFSQSEAASYTVGTLGSEVKGQAPTLYWKLDEGTGSTANSSVGAPSIKHEQSNIKVVTSVTSTTVSFNTTPKPGNLIVVAVSACIGSPIINAPSDNQGNTYTATGDDESANGVDLQVFYAKNINSSGTFTVTSSITVTCDITVAIHEYSGADKSSPFDQHVGDIGTSSSPSSGSITTTVNGMLYFAAVNHNGLNTTITAGTNYTGRQENEGGTSTMPLGTEDKIANPGSNAGTFTLGASRAWAAILSTFKPAAPPVGGTISGATWQTEDMCVTGKCLWFDGTDDNVSLVDNNLLDFAAADNFTVTSWVKRNGASSAVNYIMTKASGATFTGYKLYMDASGDLCFDTRDGTNATDTACTSAVDFDDSQWHHVEGVKTGTTKIELYIDGYLRATDSSIASTGSLANSGTFYTGVDQDGTSNEWLGFIDDVKVYRDNTARSAAQVKADYNARGVNEGASLNLSNSQNNPNSLSNGLVGYWKMDEASWATNCSTQSILDSSGNGITGAPCPNASAVALTTGKFGNGGNFDGTDDYVALTDNALFDLDSANKYTWAFWLNPDDFEEWNVPWHQGSSSTTHVAIHAHTTSDVSWGPVTAGISVGWDQAGTNQVVAHTTNNVLSAGTWAHVAVTYNGSQSNTNKFTIYVNGIDVTDRTDVNVTGTITTISPTQEYIGYDGVSGENEDGKMDEFRYYNRALSGADVASLYNFAPGPVAYWNMEEGSGTTINDKSGNANTSSAFTGNTAFANGKYGKGLTFDGVNDVARIPETASTDLGALTDSYTVSAWMKTTDTSVSNNKYIIGKEATSTTVFPFQLTLDTVTFIPAFVTSGPGGPFDSTGGTTPVNDGKWHYLTGVRDRFTDKVYLFVDGVLVDSVTDTATGSFANDSDIGIGNGGGSYNGQDFNGSVDDVKIYNYARTPKQIVEDMNAGHPAPGSPVGSSVAYWKLDEGYGTNANDSTPNDNDLTLSSAHWRNTGKYGKAWDGTGGDFRMSRASDPDLEFAAADSFALSLWYKSDSATNPAATEYLVDNATIAGAGTSTPGYAIYANTAGNICFAIDDDTTWTPDVSSCSATDFYDGNWHHIAAVRDVATDKIYLYIDAIEKDSDTDTTTATLDGNVTFFVGDMDTDNAGSGEEFGGDIDELKVYRSALNPTDVKTDFNHSSSQVLGALSTSSFGTREVESAYSEYCMPGEDSSTCAAPVGRWDFEEGSGTTTNDTSTNGNVGTISNATYTTGKIGKAINFDGASGPDQSLTVADSSSLDITPNITIEAWVYRAETGVWHSIVQKNQTIETEWKSYVLEFSDTNNLVFELGDNNDATDGGYDTLTVTAPSANVWHHIIAVGDSTTMYIYIDGLKQTTTTARTANSTTLDNTTGPLCIGGFQNDGACASSDDFNGKIDQVRIFNYARTPAQIAWDYNRGAPAAWYKFDECQGTSIKDSSGNSLTGTWTGTGGGSQTAVGTCTTASTAWGNGAAGKRNYSLSFDGTDDQVDVTNVNAIDFDINLANGLTFAAWIYANSDGEADVGNVFSKKSTTYIRTTSQSGSNLTLEASLDVGTTGLPNDATVSVANAITTGTWHHVVMTYINDADDEISFYIDGTLRATSTNGVGGPGDSSDSNPIEIGGQTTNNFDGKIDDLRVYSYELTPTQILILYNQGAVNFAPVSGAP